jgi:hypothetical protein
MPISSRSRSRRRVSAAVALWLLAAPFARAGGDAENVLTQLRQAGFRCDARSGGTECVGRIDAYSEAVAVLVPTGFRYSGRFLVHLHGYVLGNERDSSFGAILRDFEFLAKLRDAGVRTSLFVMPASRGKCDTYQEAFGKRGSFDNWVASVARAAGLSTPSEIALSGHSGAYSPIELILEQAAQGGAPARIRDVQLLDATYSALKVERYTAWLGRARAHRLWAAFRPDTSTETGSRKLWGKLSSKAFSTTQANVWESGRGEIAPGSGQGESADHWGMVRVYYPRFLKKM